MAEIIVNQISDLNKEYVFEVVVIEGNTKTYHSVTMSRSFYTFLNTKSSAREVIEKSFEFLLERESKESILSEFDLSVISRYFPEYKQISKNF